MQYKAVMLDVDGTLSPYSATALPELPTPGVIEAIRSVVPLFHVGLATSRPLYKVIPILDVLELTGFSILQNGAQIIEARTRETVWRRAVPVESLGVLYELIRAFEVPAFYTDFENNFPLETQAQLFAGPVSSFLLDGIAEAVYPDLLTQLATIPGITVHKLSSKRWPDKHELSVTSCEASKENAIAQFAVLSGIAADEIIGVGDGSNDLGLLAACGLKIAMGNAVPEIKAAADVIAPSVAEDGVAWVIDQLLAGTLPKVDQRG